MAFLQTHRTRLNKAGRETASDNLCVFNMQNIGFVSHHNCDKLMWRRTQMYCYTEARTGRWLPASFAFRCPRYQRGSCVHSNARQYSFCVNWLFLFLWSTMFSPVAMETGCGMSDFSRHSLLRWMTLRLAWCDTSLQTREWLMSTLVACTETAVEVNSRGHS